ATDRGHSAWITSPIARGWVHRLRSEGQAVIVGGNTVRRDNPQLTSHGTREHNPLRVVLSRSLDLPRKAQLWDQHEAKTLVITTKEAARPMRLHLEKLGVEVLALEQLTPIAVMSTLQQRDCLQVLWECGGTLAAPAITQGCVQKVHSFIAPKLIGGHQAPSPVGTLGLTDMTQALSIANLQCQAIGPDWLFTGYLNDGDDSAQNNT
ncbi:MAG: bifunctional diaminohydroxyphosphoribosylaminopyrimidine, partial [Cyanobacteriota bacterium]